MICFRRIGDFRDLLTYLINCSALILLFISCTDMEERTTGATGSSFRKFRITPASAGTSLTNVNCYLFRKGIFYKRYSGLALGADGSTAFNVPAGAELYFLSNIEEPLSLREMREGSTTRDEFLSYHTSADEAHSATRAPSVFYSAKVTPDIADVSFDVSLGLSLSRIDVDASDASGIKIERIYTRSAARTTSYFPSDALSHTTENCSYSFTFDTPETGKAEDIFRIYESDSPVTFIIEATYGSAPVTISTPIKQIERNKVYKIRIQSDGMNVVSNILTEDWKTGSDVTASEGGGTKIKIDPEHSLLPFNMTLDTSGTTADIITWGTTTMKLAFLTDNPLQLESLEGIVQSIGTPEVNTPDGEYLTSYEITLAPNNLPLVSCVTLNLKSMSEEETVYGKITLNIHPFPYSIQDVFIGKMTWMAFNCGASPSIYDQVHPGAYGHDNAQDMCEKNWLESRGSMMQWTANPCPDGYRLPTRMELRNLLCGDDGRGVIPGQWMTDADEMTSKFLVAASGTVNSGGTTGVPRYLELKNQYGQTLYFPLGGMKDKSTTGAEAPDLGNSLCLWSSDDAGDNKAYTFKMTYTDGSPVSPDYEFKLDKEAYAYARCVKNNY